MIIYVDIDNTICRTEGMDYKNAIPIKERINKINELFGQGDTIIYWTARGTATGEDWSDFTRKQLDGWGAYYNSVRMSKPAFDLFIDDKSQFADEFFKTKRST